MNATTAAARHGPRSREARPRAVPLSSAAAAAIGCGLLAARPTLVAAVAEPRWWLAGLFIVLGSVAAIAPLPEIHRPSVGSTPTAPRWSAPAAIAVGVGAFAIARLIGGGHSPAPLLAPFVFGNVLAAVAEELWFRRLCYGLLEPGGTWLAIVGSAALFALVHISGYGLGVFPIDFAAGLVLGWQRCVTRSWGPPAITHVIANVLVMV